jgi:hypothetical protein
MSVRFPFGGPRTPEPLPVVDGIPCRPYRTGEHAATISAMLLRRLIAAAIIAAAISLVLPFVITLVTVGGAASSDAVPAAARVAGSPLAFAIYLLLVDALLVRGRLSRTLSVLSWIAQRGSAELRQTTGLRRATDRAGARRWLAAHPEMDGEPDAVSAARIELSVALADPAGARVALEHLPRETPEQTLRADLLQATVDLAAGQPFGAEALRAQVEGISDPELRADLAARVAARVAEGRFTCQGDHLAAMAWCFGYVGRRDAGLLLRAYWMPIGILVLVTAFALAFLLPAGG